LLTVGKYYNYVASGNFARNNKIKITNYIGGSQNGFNTQIQDKDKKDRIEDVICQGFIATPSVADVSLGLKPKPIIESETENYIKAKELSKSVQFLFEQMKNLNDELRSTVVKTSLFGRPSTANRDAIVTQINSVTKQISEKNAQANALGYKILALGEIEKL
jgi:hypothetical protein